MSTQTAETRVAQSALGWLKCYYFARFAVSAIWVTMAILVAGRIPALAAVMLVAYPAWDALANYIDARQNGGIDHNGTQLLNLIVSALTSIAVLVALDDGMNSVLKVFGIWAGLAGLLQLATGVRRWNSYGAQWAMILSGAQSALAGLLFIRMAGADAPVGIGNVAPYAAFGAFYFFVSAIWLTVRDMRERTLCDAA